MKRRSILIPRAAAIAFALIAPVAAAAQTTATPPPRTTGDGNRPGGFVTVPTVTPVAPLKRAEITVAPVPPRLLTTIVGPDDYPAAAIAAGQQGRVVVRISISDTGKSTGCETVSSSGSAILDQTTCALVMERAWFEPARDEHGYAVPSAVNAPITWRIPSE